MSKPLWIHSPFSFQDLVLTKDDILVVRPVSRVFFSAIAAAIIAGFWIGTGYLSLAFVVIAVIISAAITELIAMRRRIRLSVLTVEELSKRHEVVKSIKWVVVERIEIRRGNFVIRMVGGRKYRGWIIGTDVSLATQFIRSNTIITLKVFSMRWNALTLGGVF
ncbi:MAG: hypothetical protein ACRECH_10855, partial [Nitrososphaerales archaeon]